MKKTLSFILALVMVLCMSVIAFAANNTTITVRIPCTVSLQIGEHGKVTVDGTDYTGTGSFKKDVGAAVTYTFKPNALYAIDRVIYNGADVTAQLSGKTYTAPALDGNKTLQVSFRFLGIGETTSYTVAFHANGHGTAPAAQTILEGNTAAEPTAPTANGYTFGGWYKDAACTEKYIFSNAVNGDIDLYAKWTKNSGGFTPPVISVYCTLTFDADGGSSIAPIRKLKGTMVELASFIPTREGYGFIGWYSDAALTDKLAAVTLNGDMTVYAGWEKEKPQTGSFSDIPENAYYAEAVEWALEKGVTSGIGGAAFDPDADCTRAQAVTFLWRANGCPEPRTASDPFADVAKDAYYYKPVLWAVEQGITKGTSATAFSPEQYCTRAQIVTFLYRAAGEPAAAGALFDDVPADAYYADAVKWAVAEGITNGTSATAFSPEQYCTRAQIVTFIFRQLGK